MKPFLLLAIFATGALAQDRNVATHGAEYLLRVRAADTTKQAAMHIAISGGLFGSLGASKASPGSVRLGEGGGTGTGTVIGSLLKRPGRLTFSSDAVGIELELLITAVSGARTPRLVALGKSVSVVYSDAGNLSVETRP